jgi:hypothetical protein
MFPVLWYEEWASGEERDKTKKNRDKIVRRCKRECPAVSRGNPHFLFALTFVGSYISDEWIIDEVHFAVLSGGNAGPPSPKNMSAHALNILSIFRYEGKLRDTEIETKESLCIGIRH